MAHTVTNTSASRWDKARLVFFFGVLVSTGLIFTLTPDLLPSTLISILFFFIFTPVVDALERKGMSRTFACISVFVLCGMAIALMITLVVPRISQEIEAFQKGQFRYTSQITERLKSREQEYFGKIPVVKDLHLTEKGLSWLQASNNKLWELIPYLASKFFMCLFLVPFITFVLLKDAHEIRRALLKLVPNRYFETVYGITSQILNEMGGYVAARILEAILVTFMVTISALAANIPYAILLGVFAGATNPIPYLGPLLGAIPGLLLALLEPTIPNQMLLIFLIYIIANAIDMFVIFPVVVAKIVNLHPVIVIISVILGSQLFGIVGMLIAVPITAIFKILLQEIYSRVYTSTQYSL